MTNSIQQTCPGCGGSGIQRNNTTGIAEICRVCGGCGRWKQPSQADNENQFICGTDGRHYDMGQCHWPPTSYEARCGVYP